MASLHGFWGATIHMVYHVNRVEYQNILLSEIQMGFLRNYWVYLLASKYSPPKLPGKILDFSKEETDSISWKVYLLEQSGAFYFVSFEKC